MCTIAFEQSNDGFYISQTGLIDKVLHNIGMLYSKIKCTPTSSTPLRTTDAHRAIFCDVYDYARVVGMLLYLSSNSRPDIQFSVHQCAHFTHNPKQNHGDAVNHICHCSHYLQGTKNCGLIFHTTKTMTIDCYSDADFARLWNYEDDQDPVCVKSCTGYVLMLAGCPLIWVSMLQTKIALSTLESEYIALSTAIHESIPLCCVLQEVGHALDHEFLKPSIVQSTCFEDNNGALGLARAQNDTPHQTHWS
jgi:hypothetical protein